MIETDDAQHRPLRRARSCSTVPTCPSAAPWSPTTTARSPSSGCPGPLYVARGEGRMRAYRPRRPTRRAPEERDPACRRRIEAHRAAASRGAVITGTIVDTEGQPSPGVQVTARPIAGLMSVCSRSGIVSAWGATTDDRGVYRIFGLPAGDYIIAAQVRLPGRQPDSSPTSTVDVASDAESVARSPTPSSSRSPRPSAAQPSTSHEPRRVLSLAPVYFPAWRPKHVPHR